MSKEFKECGLALIYLLHIGYIHTCTLESISDESRLAFTVEAAISVNTVGIGMTRAQ